MTDPIIGQRFGRLVARSVIEDAETYSRRVYQCDCDCGEICRRTGEKLVSVAERSMCRTCRFGQNSGGKPEYVPTPDEMTAACREIQAGWSDDERRQRRVRRDEGTTRWEVPEVKVRYESS